MALNPSRYAALFARTIAHKITTETQHQAAIEELETLTFAEETTPEEEAYCEVLVLLIEEYERPFRLPITLSPVETLRVLMDNHGLKQADLVPEIDSKSHVSEILSGTRELSKSHIAKLSQFFGISPEVFFPVAINPGYVAASITRTPLLLRQKQEGKTKKRSKAERLQDV